MGENTIKDNQAKVANEQARLQTAYGNGDYHVTLPDLHTVGIAWERKLVVICDSAIEGEGIPFADIRSADIELDNVNITTTTTTTSTNRGSQLAGGLIGGAALGPAGLIVGGLSGSTTSKAKGIGRKQICLVRLIVRVRDRANPVRSITLYEDKFGEGDEADGPFAGPALKAATHFHALLTQIVEDEGTMSREAKLPLSPSIGAALAFLFAAATVVSPTSARASDIGKVLNSPPDSTFVSPLGIYAIERCILLSDLPFSPVAYRSPDRPNESLLYLPRPVGSPPVIQLITDGGRTTIKVWNAQMGKQTRAVRTCIKQEDGS